MRSLPVLMTVVVSVLMSIGCRGNISGNSASGKPFELSMDQYSPNHFFIDTSYISLYEPYYQNDPPSINAATQVVEAEVWVEQLSAINDTSYRFGAMYIDLPPHGQGGYDSIYRYPDSVVPGSREKGRFARLDPSLFRFDADGYVGVLSIDTAIGGFAGIGIAYRRADGQQFGEFSRDVPAGQNNLPLVLKMVRPAYIWPPYREAWRMQLMNIYRICDGPISEEGFQLNIFRTSRGGTPVTSIEGRPLLNVLGLDSYGPDGTRISNGDGQFDFRPGFTIDEDKGELIFPYLRPLDDGIRGYFAARGVVVPDSFLYPQLYDTTSEAATMYALFDTYTISGRAASK